MTKLFHNLIAWLDLLLKGPKRRLPYDDWHRGETHTLRTYHKDDTR